MNRKPTDNPWTINGENTVFDNPWMRVAVYNAVNISGAKADYAIVHFKNVAVGVIPYEDDHIWMVGQYRLGIKAYSWEIPEGGGPKGEDPLDTAKRELAEETGLRAAKYERVVTTYLSNSIADEYCEIFLATGLTQGESAPEDTENLQVKKVPLAQVYADIEAGKITDSLTILGIQKLMLMKAQGRV